MHTDCPCYYEFCLILFQEQLSYNANFIAAFLMIIAQKAATNETSMGCHRVSVIFEGDKTRTPELLNANQIHQYTMKLIHKAVVFNLLSEHHSRYYPGRYRPQFRPNRI